MALVWKADADGALLGTTSSTDGTYRISPAPRGRFLLQMRYEGQRPHRWSTIDTFATVAGAKRVADADVADDLAVMGGLQSMFGGGGDRGDKVGPGMAVFAKPKASSKTRRLHENPLSTTTKLVLGGATILGFGAAAYFAYKTAQAPVAP